MGSSRVGLRLALLLEVLLAGCSGRSARAPAERAPPQTIPAPQAAPPTGAPTQNAACPADARGAVQASDARHCRVDRALFFGEHDCLIATPSIQPVSQAGRAIGFRNDSIGPSSVLGLCGIRSGDVWTKVNGASVATPDDVLELYPKLRAAEKLVIDLL